MVMGLGSVEVSGQVGVVVVVMMLVMLVVVVVSSGDDADGGWWWWWRSPNVHEPQRGVDEINRARLGPE